MKKIGLIAGKSRYPLILAEEAKKQGFSVIAVGIRGETLPEIERVVSDISWLDAGELDRLIEVFKRAAVKEAIMAGGITKGLLFKKDMHLDKSMVDILTSLKDNKDTSILTAFAHKLKSEGIELLEATSFLHYALPEKGCLTRRAPDAGEYADIRFGWDVAKELARLDIGMTVVVKNKTVLALEAIEGTDEAIKRGACLGGEGCVVVKTSRPNQDMRFDLPVVGLSTIETMKNIKSKALAIEAKQTLFFDQSQAIEEANNSGIAIVAL